MWVLLSQRLRRWLLLAIGAPLLARGLVWFADSWAVRRGGDTVLTSALRNLGMVIGQRRRRRFFGRS